MVIFNLMIAFVFPGQGVQYVGMGKNIDEKTLREIDDILGYYLSKLMLEGPEDKLRLTENAQPAIFTLSFSLFMCLRKNGPKPDLVAGHSLGEWTALACSEVISFEDALRLVRLRGRLMQTCVPEGKGAMFAIIGNSEEEIRNNLEGRVWIVNINSEDQIVISGEAGDVEKVARKFKKAIRLKVSAPFHCPLMEPVKDKLSEQLMKIKVSKPVIPVISAHTLELYTEENIRQMLIDGITMPVRWFNCVKRMIEMGVDTFIEVGPGRVLTGLIKRSFDVKAFSFSELTLKQERV